MPPKKTKPNAQCPCGSGKKHKKCCMIAGKLGVSRGPWASTIAKIQINAIFDDREPQSLGFVYSTGVAALRSETNYEFIWFGRRNLVERVSLTMNFLASRIESGHVVSGNQTVESGPNIIWRITTVSESRNHELLDEYAVKCCPATTLLELDTCHLPPAAGDTCFVETFGVDDSMICLSRELPSGRIIRVDTQDGDMLKGGAGIAHVNMNNGDDSFHNLKLVTEQEARQMLMAFQEWVGVGLIGPFGLF